MVVPAQNNWWGDPTGPRDTSDDRGSGGLYNPDGKGDRVTDRVNYVPWQKITALLYGTTIATGGNTPLVLAYSYDALNRLSGFAASGPTGLAMFYHYDLAGRLIGAGPDASPGISVTHSFNNASMLTRLANRSPNGAVVFNDFHLTYDRNGTLLGVSDAAGSTTYTYDAGGQLTGVSGPGLNETYTYDVIGNRLSRGSQGYTYDAAGRLVGSTDGAAFTYDAAGNLRTRARAGQTTTYNWDAGGQLVRIDFPNGTYAEYTYDALGHRVSKRAPDGTVTYYIWDGKNLTQEVAANGAVVVTYVHDGLNHPLAMARGGRTYYYLYNDLGSVVGLTDGAGGLVTAYRYDPWGNVTASGPQPNLDNPFRFAGYLWDVESGLYYLHARYYDPALGRFLSPDPALSQAAFNPYVYASNDPVNNTDPTGLAPRPVYTIDDDFFYRVMKDLYQRNLRGKNPGLMDYIDHDSWFYQAGNADIFQLQWHPVPRPRAQLLRHRHAVRARGLVQVRRCSPSSRPGKCATVFRHPGPHTDGRTRAMPSTSR